MFPLGKITGIRREFWRQFLGSPQELLTVLVSPSRVFLAFQRFGELGKNSLAYPCRDPLNLITRQVKSRVGSLTDVRIKLGRDSGVLHVRRHLRNPIPWHRMLKKLGDSKNNCTQRLAVFSKEWQQSCPEYFYRAQTHTASAHFLSTASQDRRLKNSYHVHLTEDEAKAQRR